VQLAEEWAEASPHGVSVAATTQFVGRKVVDLQQRWCVCPSAESTGRIAPR
jgi:hypothetical protein